MFPKRERIQEWPSDLFSYQKLQRFPNLTRYFFQTSPEKKHIPTSNIRAGPATSPGGASALIVKKVGKECERFHKISRRCAAFACAAKLFSQTNQRHRSMVMRSGENCSRRAAICRLELFFFNNTTMSVQPCGDQRTCVWIWPDVNRLEGGVPREREKIVERPQEAIKGEEECPSTPVIKHSIIIRLSSKSCSSSSSQK